MTTTEPLNLEIMGEVALIERMFNSHHFMQHASQDKLEELRSRQNKMKEWLDKD